MSLKIKPLLAACGLTCVFWASTAPGQAVRPAPTQQPPTPAPTQTPAASPLTIQAKPSQSIIDDSLSEDAATLKAIAPFTPKVREMARPIGKLAEDVKKFGVGAGTLGNLVTDAMRNRAATQLGKPVVLAITNAGGLRKNEIKAGDISELDIFELMPFENALVTVDLTGEQLKGILDIITSHRDAQSGARIVYRPNEQKQNVITKVRLGDNDKDAVEIDPTATYTIVTIDYLVKRGGDYALLQQSKNVKPLNLTLRDAMLAYVKAETAAGRALKSLRDYRWRYDRSNPATPAPKEDEEP